MPKAEPIAAEIENNVLKKEIADIAEDYLFVYDEEL